MPTKIRHIAIFSDEPKKLADFYAEVFGTTTTGLADNGSAWITDGYMDVALLARRGRADRKNGIHHWGFTVDEAEKPGVVARLQERGAKIYSPYVDSPDAHRPYAEDAVIDPDGNRFDLSTGMRKMREGGVSTSSAEVTSDVPKIKHLAIFSDDPARLAKFYSEVFGLRVTGESQGDVWVTDGYVDVALISRKNAKGPSGINHWGFTLPVEAKPAIYAALTAKGFAPKDPRAENPRIDRPFVEEAGWDIDGNRFDLATGKRDMDEEKARTRARLASMAPAK